MLKFKCEAKIFRNKCSYFPYQTFPMITEDTPHFKQRGAYYNCDIDMKDNTKPILNTLFVRDLFALPDKFK